MKLQTIGSDLAARNDQGRLLSRIATIFPHDHVVVTLPGIHATQREAYLDLLNQDRQARGLAPMTREEKTTRWQMAVDLILDEDAVLIRPSPDNMQLAFAADDALQAIMSKSRIRFLNALNPDIHDAIKRRGECWRITPLPKSIDEMKRVIVQSRCAVGCQNIYRYSSVTGTRWLTYDAFLRMDKLNDDDLRKQLAEIRQYCACWNDQGNKEVDFFLADKSFRARFTVFDFVELDSSALRASYGTLKMEFASAVREELREDDIENAGWRRRMFAALMPHGEDVASEEELLGLGSEFFMQIEWLPGGRIDKGELILDSVLDTICHNRCKNGLASLDFSHARNLLFNLVREYGDLEYVNVGRVVSSLARRRSDGGRRGVYVVEMKRRDSVKETLKIIRMQKWGVREHLDEGKPLLEATLNSEEYTEYILDRRLACRQLGMNLPVQVVTRKISETYLGKQKHYRTTRIWSPYFERDYIRGIATDMVPLCRFEDHEFAIRFAILLGRAAASNIIVGRQSQEGVVIFDNGDEVMIEDKAGLPADMLVADHTGAFVAFETDIYALAEAYGEPVKSRLTHVKNPTVFAEAYLGECLARFARIQQEYRSRRRSFDSLFADRPHDKAGSLAYRWEKVLQRLDKTNLDKLEVAIRKNLI